MKEIIIASFYKFVPIQDFESMREPLLNTMHEMGIKGTLLLAHEGVNGSFAGTREQMTAFYAYMRSFEPFTDLNFKETFDTENPFDKSKVKLRKEIVTMGVTNLDPSLCQDTHLSPEEWHQMIQDPEVLVLDTRNDYEYELGTFKNAINPNIENFRDFPKYVEEQLSDKKDKKIAMFCTGGIRCEKTAAYMRQQGFQHVFQLHDGILNYIESVDESDSLWEGSCFVFDERIAVDHRLNRVHPQLPQDYKHDRSLIKKD